MTEVEGVCESDAIRGNVFAAWLQAALIHAGLTPKGLADASKRVLGEPMSPGYLGILLKGGYKPETGKVMQPNPDFIERIARLTGADAQTGLQSAGYWPPPSALSGCRVRYVLLPEGCPQETEQVLTQLAHVLANPFLAGQAGMAGLTVMPALAVMGQETKTPHDVTNTR